MADIHKSRGRILQRGYEWNRLEEQLWTVAYEQIWPVIRRGRNRRQSEQRPQQQAGILIARRA
jgi:hypothetical protein